MNICVFGAGSLGSALGGMLSSVHDVTLVGRRRHIQEVRKNGLHLIGDVNRRVRLGAYESVARVQSPDLLLISTKAYDTGSAIRACRTLVSDETKVLTLQNGLGNLEMLGKWVGDRAFGGTTTMGAAIVRPGTVRVSGLGVTTVGSCSDLDKAMEIAQALGECGLHVRTSTDVMADIWGKAVINAAINPTAAILRVRNGVLLENRTILHFMRDVCRECEQVSRASGITLPHASMYPRVRAVCRDTADNISSMLQDVDKGRKTEIHQINGAFCTRGEELSVPAPMNRTLVAMVDALHLFHSGERLIS